MYSRHLKSWNKKGRVNNALPFYNKFQMKNYPLVAFFITQTWWSAPMFFNSTLCLIIFCDSFLLKTDVSSLSKCTIQSLQVCETFWKASILFAISQHEFSGSLLAVQSRFAQFIISQHFILIKMFIVSIDLTQNTNTSKRNSNPMKVWQEHFQCQPLSLELIPSRGL